MSFVSDMLFGKDEPDTSGINDAARMSAELGNKAFDWFTKEYDRTAPDRAKAQDEASQVTTAQLASMRQQDTLAKDYADYNKSTFRPLEQKMVADSQAYDTPERRQAAADAAVADVNSQVAQQRQATQMDLARSGVTPDSMQSQALMASGDINAARVAAGAASTARRNVEATGYARMADAVNLGRNLPSAQATAVQTGVQAGQGALAGSQAGMAAGQAGTGLMQSGFSTAMQGQGQSGALFGKAADIDNTTRGQNLNFLSSIYGSTMKASDPKVKSDRKAVSTASMLDAIEKTPVESWKYDPEKGGPDDGGQTHVGPMADRVQAMMGDGAAPGGKVVDLVSMNGVTMGAVQELAKRVKKLESNRKAA